ncbi:MAG: hypothetical protein HPY45_08130 [Anaerolineae bacterium]|nr:hypothetical protein [Anaerolineae bacterium]
MVQEVFWGMGQGLDGYKAAREASEKALGKMGTARPTLAVAFVCKEYDMRSVMRGLNALLGGIPLWGFSTIAPILSNGEQDRCVVVAILCGREYKVQVECVGRDMFDEVDAVVRGLQESGDVSGMLLAADGIQPPPDRVYEVLGQYGFPVCGGFACGDDEHGAYQIGGGHVEEGAISFLALGGRCAVGAGNGHGWQETGMLFTVGSVVERSIKSLDGVAAVEVYSRIFGRPVENWVVQPWSELVRLYPLGVEHFPGSKALLLRSPLGVNQDGSLRMNASVAEGQIAHLLVGDTQACLEAVKLAALQALQELREASPVLALLFVDVAWRYLFNDRLQSVMEQLRQVLGEIPLIGAYTYGQIHREALSQAPQVLNQHLQVVLIGRRGE